jgi:hypothetical protein
MKKLILLFAIIFAHHCQAQTIVKDANGNYQQVQKAKEEPTKTGNFYTDSKGIKYPIYKSARGKLFVLKTSKNTGNQYKMYLNSNN